MGGAQDRVCRTEPGPAGDVDGFGGTDEARAVDLPVRAEGELAVVLTGGGARAAYQVGVLRGIGKRHPDLRFDIVTGVSAGAINATYVASHSGGLGEASEDLGRVWEKLHFDNVFEVESGSLLKSFLGWGGRLVSGGMGRHERVRGLVDTKPLRKLLEQVYEVHWGEIVGVGRNLRRGVLGALSLSTVDYATGQTVNWVQGNDVPTWCFPQRLSRETRITVDHVMASAALPLLFPAVRLGRHWYGDGGVRLAAPLSPALRLGADRILAISTRHLKTPKEASVPVIEGYPPPAQILGSMLNAIFLDVLDQDVRRLERLNHLLQVLPEEDRGGLRPIDIIFLRPSEDLGRLSAKYEARLPKGFRFATRGLGTRETDSPDFLSLLMFQPDYVSHLMEIGERDVEAHVDAIAALLGDRGAGVALPQERNREAG